MLESKRFVIIGHPRSASTWLAQGLAEHDDILMYGEILNPDLAMRKEGVAHGLRYETHLRELPEPYSPPRRAAEFIEELLQLSTKTRHAAVGFKIHYEHAWGGPAWNSAWKLIFGDPSIHKIHLYRRDLLRAFVSLQIAIQTDQWVATQEHPAAPRDSVRLRVDMPAFRSFVRHCRRMQTLVRECAARHPVLELVYEDSVAVRPDEVCRSVYEWLGQPSQEVENYIVRQDAFDVEAVVVNYDEARECWRNMANASDR